MKLSRRQILKAVGAASVVGAVPKVLYAQDQKPEKEKLTIAVGGQALVYYLPLSVALYKGFFEEQGLDVKVADFAGGSKALQAVVGGSADVCSGAFEHTISLQSKKQSYKAFVLQGRAPMITLGVSSKTMADYQSPEDLKGKKIGVTAPGSSTNMLLSFFLNQHGMKDSDISVIGVGAGSGAVNALKSGQVDAMCNVDPVISLLDHEGLLKTIVDTRTLKDTEDVFGGPMPAGCLYAANSFIEKNPITTQALTNAIVKADQWIQSAGVDAVIDLVPKQYLLGNPDVYKLALEKSFEGLSPDGLIDEKGPETALNALVSYQGNFKKEDIDLSQCWTNDFVKKVS